MIEVGSTLDLALDVMARSFINGVTVPAETIDLVDTGDHGQMLALGTRVALYLAGADTPPADGKNRSLWYGAMPALAGESCE